jgi:hypothetical protein
MNDFLNEKLLDKQSIKSYEQSDIILTLFFVVIDLIVILLSSFNLKAKNKKITAIKLKILKVFIFDIIIRILYIRKYNSQNFYKEALLSIMNTSQFYLIISFLDQVLYNKKLTKFQQSIIKHKQTKLCILFFLITFSYEKLPYPDLSKYFKIPLYKIILFIQSLCVLFCIYKLYGDLKKKITDIVTNIKIETQDKKQISLIRLYLMILGSPLSCLFLFIFYYIVKIAILFIYKPLIALYANILLNIIKNASKYFAFIICLAIIYVLNKISVEKEKEKQKQNKLFLEEFEIFND